MRTTIEKIFQPFLERFCLIVFFGFCSLSRNEMRMRGIVRLVFRIFQTKMAVIVATFANANFDSVCVQLLDWYSLRYSPPLGSFVFVLRDRGIAFMYFSLSRSHRYTIYHCAFPDYMMHYVSRYASLCIGRAFRIQSLRYTRLERHGEILSFPARERCPESPRKSRYTPCDGNWESHADKATVAWNKN